jgi:hypothetical protein
MALTWLRKSAFWLDRSYIPADLGRVPIEAEQDFSGGSRICHQHNHHVGQRY